MKRYLYLLGRWLIRVNYSTTDDTKRPEYDLRAELRELKAKHLAEHEAWVQVQELHELVSKLKIQNAMQKVKLMGLALWNE